MTALGTEIAASFARGFALLEDLRRLAPAEHAELVRRCIEQLGAVTKAERSRRARRAIPEDAR